MHSASGIEFIRFSPDGVLPLFGRDLLHHCYLDDECTREGGVSIRLTKVERLEPENADVHWIFPSEPFFLWVSCKTSQT